MPRFCPKCGKRIEKGVFCEDCKPRSIDFKVSKIKICCECNKIHSHGTWKKTKNIDAAIKKEIKSKIKQKGVKINLIGDMPELKPGIKKEFIAEVIHEQVIHEIPFQIEVTYCPNCAKKGTQYFEGVLQIRNFKKNAKKAIDSELYREEVHGNNVNKVVKFDNGIDFYMTNKSAMPKLAQRIISKTGGLFHSSVKLFSHNHQTGKEIYRLNLLLELPEFEVGDVYYFKGKYIIIKKMGKNIIARNLMFDKKVMFTYKEFKESKYIDRDSIKRLEKFKTKVIRVRPEIEVLHPETYQELKVLNKNKKVNLDEAVEVVLTKKGAIII
jgi:NMD protein affecting ribosome stability and mRNA decay